MIRCGHCKGRHSTVTGVQTCWAYSLYLSDTAQVDAEIAAELVIERKLEDRCYYAL